MRILASFFLAFILFSCVENTEKEHSTNKHTDTTQVAFSDKITVKHAKGFQVTYKDNYKVLSLFNPFSDQPDTLQYILLPKGVERPQEYPKAQTISIPVEKMVALSTTHVGLIEALQSNDVLVGLGGTNYIYSEDIKARVASKKIAALNDQGLNEELIVSLQPNILMVSGMPQGEFSKYQKLSDLGVNVVINSEWLENTPLGKAEWVKFMAVFLNKEKEANLLFDNIEKEYQRIATLAQNIPVEKRKVVYSGIAYKGTWYIAGGQSFMANFLKDAGVVYPWADVPQAGSFPLAFEEIYAKVINADVWMNPEGAKSLGAIKAQDTRYTDFKAYKDKAVYNRTKRLSSNGGNDYWESGVVKPHLVLADLVKILYPELLPEHTLYYYEPLPESEVVK